MPIYVSFLDATPIVSEPAGTVVTAEIPQIDDCKILTRLKGFVINQGSAPMLEHVFRDRVTGNPIDLSAYLANASDSTSSSSLSSSAVVPAGTTVLRLREALATGPNTAKNPIWTYYGDAWDAANGVVRVTIPAEATTHACIYEASWAVVNSVGQPLFVDRSLLCVERSLFTTDAMAMMRNLGPPALQELRMLMMDSSRNENILLDDIEFKDEQLLLALIKPVQFWNENPPPIGAHTTRTFPYRGAWASGVLGQLHLMAAAHYRRNLLKHSAGGTAINDKDKEKEYLSEGQRLWQEYAAWVSSKKIELNMQLFSGQNLSPYSSNSYGRTGW